jgi:hypothetical protein
MSGITPARRVRHDVRDGLMVMVFSLLTSIVLALVLTTLVHVGK